jgi:membrane peptidoglycan carboxypeptidase
MRRAAVRWVATRGRDAVAEAGRQPAKVRAAARSRARLKAAARVVSRQEADFRSAAAREAARRAAELRLAERRRATELRRAEERRAIAKRTAARLIARERARRIRRRRILATAAAGLTLASIGLAIGAYYVDTIPTPAELELPESTTIYYADGVTTMAKLGTENRTILPVTDMNDAVKQAIVAAEDRTFWTHGGVDFSSVMRAAWNNVTGGQIQGASSITQQYARIAADLRGVTYARKAREAVLAWKIDENYHKEQVLEFYLNTIPFGRGAYGIEAAAQAFFGKTAKRDAPPEEQVTVAEAMVLASLVKQPEPDPVDPEGSPGYDPARGGTAAANSISRWEYVREGMVLLGYLSLTEANALEYPHTVRALNEAFSQDRLDLPTGLVVNHVLSELRQREPFKGTASDHIRTGGYRIVTTIDKRAQDAAEASADIRRATAPAAVRGQPANWQAALVAVEPGTGRVLAYYGGSNGTGADHAGWFLDDEGNPRGFGQHPPGSSFKVYDLAEALRQQVSLFSKWPSPAVKEFPASGRTRGTKAGPVRNATTAPCQPNCTLWEATVASLNVTFFDLTERLGAANVIDMASRAGIDSMWTDRAGDKDPVRVDLKAKTGKELMAVSSGSSTGLFTTEVGIGQYGVTVLDHASGMATFAAGGKRAQSHFVREVTRRGERVYAESLTQANIGLTAEQVDELTWTLSQVPSAKLSNGWDAAGKTGTWQDAASTTRNAHTWMVGYTRSLAVAVWLGTTDGKALITADGKTNVFGSTHPATIWRQFMTEAIAGLALDPKNRTFRTPKLAPTPSPARPAPSATPD